MTVPEQHDDYVRALEEECARANVYIGLLRVAAIQGDKPHFAVPDYAPYERYRDARDHRFAVRAPAHNADLREPTT